MRKQEKQIQRHGTFNKIDNFTAGIPQIWNKNMNFDKLYDVINVSF